MGQKLGQILAITLYIRIFYNLCYLGTLITRSVATNLKDVLRRETASAATCLMLSALESNHSKIVEVQLLCTTDSAP